MRDTFRVTGSGETATWEPATETVRVFDLGGQRWEARTAGSSAYGTGPHSLARLVAVRFFAPDSASPAREAVLPAGVFETLFDEELCALFARAVDLTGRTEPEA